MKGRKDPHMLSVFGPLWTLKMFNSFSCVLFSWGICHPYSFLLLRVFLLQSLEVGKLKISEPHLVHRKYPYIFSPTEVWKDGPPQAVLSLHSEVRAVVFYPLVFSGYQTPGHCAPSSTIHR